ncbi:MAG: hypothetical protein WD336_02820 [Trueperaceae bacterium]
MPKVDSALGLYGLILAALGSLFVLYFWSMGALFLLQNEGFIAELQLAGGWRTAFWSYPFLTLGAIAAGAIAFLARRYDVAVAAAGLPLVAAIGYYFALVLVR